MKKTSRNALVLTGTALLLALTTACSGSGVSGVDNPSSGTPSVSATPTVQSIAGTVVNGMPTKPELTVDAQGRSYVQTSIKADDPMVAYDPSVRTPRTIGLFTEEQIQSAQKFANTYFAEEVMDSFVKGDNITQADKELWWEQHKDKYDPVFMEPFNKVLMDPYSPKDVVLYQNPERAAKGYAVEYGADKVQISSRHINYREIQSQVIEGVPYIGFETDIYFEIPVVKTDGTKAFEKVSLSGEVVYKEVSPGEWLISGQNVVQSPVTYSK